MQVRAKLVSSLTFKDSHSVRNAEGVSRCVICHLEMNGSLWDEVDVVFGAFHLHNCHAKRKVVSDDFAQKMKQLTAEHKCLCLFALCRDMPSTPSFLKLCFIMLCGGG